MDTAQHLLVFGASGAIGTAVVRSAVQRGWKATAVTRKLPEVSLPEVQLLALDPLSVDFSPSQFPPSSIHTRVCWPHGRNANHSIYNLDLAVHLEIYHANSPYILL